MSMSNHIFLLFVLSFWKIYYKIERYISIFNIFFIFSFNYSNIFLLTFYIAMKSLICFNYNSQGYQL